MNILDLIIDDCARQVLNEAFQKYGIEKTEDKINQVYQDPPKIRKLLLKKYKAVLKRRK